MARVFTITPGLENLGGLKSGGQGSLYKGRRIGEILTAIKILPTPVSSEYEADSRYAAFKKEVAKLARTSESPDPNVVKLLGWGITETGNFPYIEMEYIDGPDLETLLQLPDRQVFSVNETIKVAEQLSAALAHCHKVEVTHGNINCNSIKYNLQSGKYVLLDFGHTLLIEDERRNQLKNNRATEFLAPEQNSGHISFQSDLYNLGTVLFKLLTGSAPFVLAGEGEPGRNELRLQQMSSPVPDPLPLRSAALPAKWASEMKEREMRVPDWFIGLIKKCLEKKPEKRFADGVELHTYIVRHLSATWATVETPKNSMSVQPMQHQDYVVYHEQLKRQIAQYQQELLKKELELSTLTRQLNAVIATETGKGLEDTVIANYSTNSKKVSKGSFVAVLLLTIALGAFATYTAVTNQDSLPTFFGSRTASETNTTAERQVLDESGERVTSAGQEQTIPAPVFTRNAPPDDTEQNTTTKQGQAEEQQPTVTIEEAKPAEDSAESDNEASRASADENEEAATDAEKTTEESSAGTGGVSKKYLVTSKAYFYDEPNEDSKRNEFISPLEKAVVHALNERYGFIYVVITNPNKQVFKGWLYKKDLKLYSFE